MKKHTRNRRGVSLVETVIAMTVVVIVSIAALSAISASMNVNARDQAAFEARTDARNALEQFRYDSTYEPESQFGVPFVRSGSDYTADYGWCVLTVTINGNHFAARAVEHSGKALFEVTYEK